MLKIENVVLPSPEQWAAVIRGMRNPKNSWDKSDSIFIEDGEYFDIYGNSGPENDIVYSYGDYVELGQNDIHLANILATGGPVHGKYRRMIPVYLDITAPLYWWKEFDTYKIGTVADSCSTMHKIHAKAFTFDDFSEDHLINDGDFDSKDTLANTICALNHFRKLFFETKDKKYWWQLIQLLPSSYNQKRTIFLNYEVLSQMYIYRKDHKLDEWHTLCDWIETLPYFKEIIIPEKYGNEMAQ